MSEFDNKETVKEMGLKMKEWRSEWNEIEQKI